MPVGVALAGPSRSHHLRRACDLSRPAAALFSLPRTPGVTTAEKPFSALSEQTSAIVPKVRNSPLARQIGLYLGSLLTCFGLKPSVCFSSEQDPRVVALVAVVLPTSLEQARETIETAILRGLKTAGWSGVGRDAVTARLGTKAARLYPCRSETCLVDIARLSGAPYVMDAVITINRHEYTLKLRLWDAESGAAPLATEDLVCEIADPTCPPVPQTATTAAGVLVGKATRAIRAAREAHVEVDREESLTVHGPASVASPSVTSRTPPPAVPGSQVEHRSERAFGRTVGWTAIGAGMGLIAIAGAYWVFDGRRADCQETTAGERCFSRTANRPLVYAFGGAGLAVTIAGGILLYEFRPSGIQMSASLEGVSVRGRF